MARVVARLDRDERLAFLSMDAPDGATWLEPLPEEERRLSSRVVLPDGRYAHGAEALVALSELLPGFGPVGRLVRRFDLERPVDAFEQLVSRNRGRLGKVVPNVPPVRRYP